VASALSDLARLARDQGDLEEARAHCRQVLALGSIGRRTMVRLLEELAGLAAASGEPERTLVLFAAAAGLRHRLGRSAPVAERPWMRRIVEDQRALLGGAASAAWSQGWLMSAEQAIRYASDGV
jgi:hypothetical protein